MYRIGACDNGHNWPHLYGSTVLLSRYKNGADSVRKYRQKNSMGTMHPISERGLEDIKRRVNHLAWIMELCREAAAATEGERRERIWRIYDRADTERMRLLSIVIHELRRQQGD